MKNDFFVSCYDCAYRGEFIEAPNEHEVPPLVDVRYVRKWIRCEYPVPFHIKGLLVPYEMYTIDQCGHFSIEDKPLNHFCDRYIKTEICPNCGCPMIAFSKFGCSKCGYNRPESFIEIEEMNIS